MNGKTLFFNWRVKVKLQAIREHLDLAIRQRGIYRSRNSPSAKEFHRMTKRLGGARTCFRLDTDMAIYVCEVSTKLSKHRSNALLK